MSALPFILALYYFLWLARTASVSSVAAAMMYTVLKLCMGIAFWELSVV